MMGLGWYESLSSPPFSVRSATAQILMGPKQKVERTGQGVAQILLVPMLQPPPVLYSLGLTSLSIITEQNGMSSMRLQYVRIYLLTVSPCCLQQGFCHFCSLWLPTSARRTILFVVLTSPSPLSWGVCVLFGWDLGGCDTRHDSLPSPASLKRAKSWRGIASGSPRTPSLSHSMQLINRPCTGHRDAKTMLKDGKHPLAMRLGYGQG